MLHIYVICGKWISCANNGWNFVVDDKRGGRLVGLESTTSIEELKTMISEDYGIERGDVAIEFSFLPRDFANKLGSPPVIISNDRQVKNFVGYVRKKTEIQLCVTFKRIVHFDLNKEPEEKKSNDVGSAMFEKNKIKVGRVMRDNEFKISTIDGHVSSDVGDASDDDLLFEKLGEKSDKVVGVSLANLTVVRKSQRFESKKVLKSTMEMCAVKNNFDYKVVDSDTTRWIIQCSNNLCNWRLRATNVAGSRYFVVTKYVPDHTCAPSSKTKVGKTPSAKTIGRLIMHRYEGVPEGPKPNDVIQIMRAEHGVEILYSLAFDAREYAVNLIRGIPDKSYGKIPKYLYMLKAANPDTHYDFETDSDGRFKYLFVSFGQSIRGFHKVMRRVVIVDGTFLKNKFKGVLLVATTQDGNSNLYPLAFRVVDSENDASWEWFMRQLNVVIADDRGLSFVSDRHFSIVKALEKVYPQARHGICIHHLLNNVVTRSPGKGVAALVAEASKVYRPAEFKEKFDTLCNISPTIGMYLIEADVRKWERWTAYRYRYDIRTNNPAESINSALRSPREYRVIPLLDSIREMLTRWFYKRRTKSGKHNQPLTIKIEKKVARRLKKGKNFIVYPINEHRFLVRGDSIDCLVDLNERTCTCGKYDLAKIPCRHAIKAGLSIKRESHTLTDEKYTTVAWRVAYEESINPIFVPEDSWRVPREVELAHVLPPETRRQAGRRRKRRYESAEDKIRSSQESKRAKRNKCSRCHTEGHNRATCTMPI